MTPEQFVMWLKGYVDAKRGSDMAIEDWDDITAQLETVVTASANPYLSEYARQIRTASILDAGVAALGSARGSIGKDKP